MLQLAQTQSPSMWNQVTAVQCGPHILDSGANKFFDARHQLYVHLPRKGGIARRNLINHCKK